MTVLLAIVAVILLMVCLALLGTMREVVVLQGKVTAFTELMLKPPAPAFLDGMLPDRVRARLLDAGIGQQGDDVFLIFARKGCAGCARLLQSIKAGLTEGTLSSRQFVCVLDSHSGGDSLEQAIRDSGMVVLVDQDRFLANACQVKQTPTTFHLGATSLKVVDSNIGGEFEWVRSRLALQADRPVATR